MQISRPNGQHNYSAEVASTRNKPAGSQSDQVATLKKSVISKEQKARHQKAEEHKLLAASPANEQHTSAELNTKELRINSQYAQFLPELVTSSILTMQDVSNDSIRGRLVTDGQNNLTKNAIQNYLNNQSLEDIEHISDVLGIDVYA